jgi:phosphatidylglycerophosphatase A
MPGSLAIIIVLISTSIPDRKLSVVDRLACFIGTGAGAGLIPVAPGTFGSIEGAAIFACISLAIARTGTDRASARTGLWLLIIAVNLFVFGVGVWASGRVARLLGTSDPGRVVIDEVSGQLISLTPLLFGSTWQSILLGFILFRAFDILKPYPISKLERLPGGWGIMMDDVGAGVLAAGVLSVMRALQLF